MENINGNGIVLGAGLTGIICGYLTGFPVMGKQWGGKVTEAGEFNFGPLILEHTPNTEKFIASVYNDKVFAKTHIREFKVHTLYYEWLYKTINKSGVEEFPIPENIPLEYYQMTRNSDKITDTAMSGQKRVIRGYDLKEIDLAYKLMASDRIKFIEEDVESVSMLNKSVNGIMYGNIISTIPLNKLLGLSGIISSYGPCMSSPTVFSVFEIIDGDLPLKQNEYMYVVGMQQFHRITYRNELFGIKRVVIESRAPLKELQTIHITKVNGEKKHINITMKKLWSQTIDECQILNDINMDFLFGIELEGRYGRWSQSQKLNCTIDNILERYVCGI